MHRRSTPALASSRLLVPFALVFLDCQPKASDAPPSTSEPHALLLEEACPTRGLPPIHAVARYVDGRGSSHDLELWRDGEGQLRRISDESTYLIGRTDSEGEIAYTFFAGPTASGVEVHERNLQHVGIFASDGELSTLVVRPRGHYTVEPVERSSEGHECTWFRLERPGFARTEICWSSTWGLALRVDALRLDGDPETLVEVDRVDRLDDASGVFELPETVAVIRADDELDAASD